MSDDSNKNKNLIKAQNDKIKSLSSQVKDLNTQVTTLTEEKSTLETQVKTLTEAANTPNAEVISFQEEKLKLEKTIYNIKECIESTPTCSDEWDMIKANPEATLAGDFCKGIFDQCVDFYN